MHIKTKGTWRDVADSARTTVGLQPGDKEVSRTWRKKILLAEHSPIRQLQYKWKWSAIPFWVSTHFVRHWLGIIHWVRTSRTDRTGVDRSNLPQGNLVMHECEANAQALINISRKRLCMQASPETREAWQAVKDGVAAVDPEMAAVMVPECLYRGFCAEVTCCGYCNTPQYQEALLAYRDREVR